MSSRDDMVMRPNFRAGEESGEAPEELLDEKDKRHNEGKGEKEERHLLKRLLKIRAVRKLRKALRNRTIGKLDPIRKAGLSGIATGMFLLAGAAFARLYSGRSFENMGANLNEALLGDVDEQVSAQARARASISGNPLFAQIIGRQGRLTAQFQALAEVLRNQYYIEERGKSALLRAKDLQANSTLLDQLIIRFRDGFLSTFRRIGGERALDNLGKKIRARGFAKGIRL